MTSRRIRVQRDDRERCKALTNSQTVREMAEVEEGEDLTYEDVFDVLLPEATEETILRRPEEDMVPINLDGEYHEKVHGLAGENVPVHRVIRHYLNVFYERYDLNLEDLQEENDGQE